MKKNFIGIGGGNVPGWSFETKDTNQSIYQTKEIDEFIVSLTQKESPKLLFIGTASRENPIYFTAIKNVYEKLGCIIDRLEILNKYIDTSEIKEKILSSDIIYIGGGNTKFMLKTWNEIGLENILIEAYNKGIVVAGFSAGCYSFFKYNYELIQGFNIINAITCVHYNEKSEEKIKQFYETIKQYNLPGIALDNGTAIYYFGNKFKIIKSLKKAKAYRIIYKDFEFIKQELEEDVEYDL